VLITSPYPDNYRDSPPRGRDFDARSLSGTLVPLLSWEKGSGDEVLLIREKGPGDEVI